VKYPNKLKGIIDQSITAAHRQRNHEKFIKTQPPPQAAMQNVGFGYNVAVCAIRRGALIDSRAPKVLKSLRARPQNCRYENLHKTDYQQSRRDGVRVALIRP
jgi:hypothetical protein